MKKTRKYISVCLCVVMFASMCLCVGCQKKAETIEKKKKQIELWHYWDIPGNQQHLEKLVDQFNQSQDEIEVKVSYIPDEDFKKQLALSIFRFPTDYLKIFHIFFRPITQIRNIYHV